MSLFFSDNLVAKKGALAKVWLAAHWERKLSKTQFLQTNIESSVGAIIESEDGTMALRLSGQLLLGVVRIYSRKAKYLLEDCNEALIKVKMAFRPGVVDLTDEQAVATFNSITLGDVMTEFDILLPEPSLDLRNLLSLNNPGGNNSNNRQSEMPLSQNISRPQDITIADVTKSSFFIDSHHGDGMMDLFDQVPEKLLLQQKQKAAAHISGLMGVGGPSGLKDHSEVAVGVADDMDVGDWDLNLNDDAGGFQLDLGDVLMDANNEMLDATAAGDSSMDIEVGRDGAANRSFSPLNPARDSLASFEANKNGENGDADDFVGQDNILDNAPDQNFSFELGGGEPADAAAREEAAAEQVFNAEPADQSNADFDLPIMDMDQSFVPEENFNDENVDKDANQSIVQKRTVKQKSRSKSTASRKRKLILDSVIELQSSHMKANLSNQKDLLRQMLYVPATTTIINLMDIQDQGVDYYLGDMTLASCRPEFQYMFKISKVIGKDGRLKKLRQRKCIADSAIENDVAASKNYSNQGQQDDFQDVLDDHQQQQALDEIDFNNMPDMPDMPDDIQPFDQTRGDESALDLLPPQDDLALDNTILGGEDSYQYMEEPSQNIEERDGQDIPEEDKYQSRVNVESSSSAAHPGDTSKIKDLFEFEDETSQQLQQQQQQTNEYGFSVSTVRTMKMLHSSFSENDGEELSYNEMTTSASRGDAVKLFFELLVLKTKDLINVDQKTPFGDITVMTNRGNIDALASF